jgi:hypothetical protein
MIKIQSVEIKKTKTGKDYKFLTLEDNVQVAMWSDDPDYTIAESGIELDRMTQKEGKWVNLLPIGERPSQGQTSSKNSTEQVKLEAIYWLLQEITKKYDNDMSKIFEKFDIQYQPFERIKQKDPNYPTPTELGINMNHVGEPLPTPEELDISSDDIPF